MFIIIILLENNKCVYKLWHKIELHAEYLGYVQTKEIIN